MVLLITVVVVVIIRGSLDSVEKSTTLIIINSKLGTNLTGLKTRDKDNTAEDNQVVLEVDDEDLILSSQH